MLQFDVQCGDAETERTDGTTENQYEKTVTLTRQWQDGREL